MKLLSKMIAGIVLSSATVTTVYAAPLFSAVSPDLLTQARQGLTAGASIQSKQLSKIQGNATTKGYSLVNINTATLDQASLDLNLSSTDTEVATRKKINKRSASDYSWFGTTKEGYALLSVHGDAVEGIIHKAGKVYQLKSLGNGLHALVEIDQSKYPRDEPLGFDSTPAINPIFSDVLRPITQATLNSSKPKATVIAAAATPVIDVLVAYTPAVLALYADTNALLAHIQLAVDDANQSYSNSVVNAKLNLVKTTQVTYTENTTSSQSILNDFKGKTDGYMDDVHALITSSKSDVNVLIVNKDGLDSCGIAATIGGATTTNDFVVVQDSCAVGNHSFAHELGHIFGARHDTANDPTTTPYAYGHGYHYQSAWRTIMAYPSSCPSGCTRLGYWSNPNVTYPTVVNGVTKAIPMGTTAKEDNARVLNANVSVLANIR
jgi:hypothetical protein